MHPKFLFAALLSVFICANALAQERITQFHSDIVVNKDRSVQITETISVIAEHNDIRHGIYRDFPTVYPHPTLGKLGLREKTGFNLDSVTVDGQNSPWHQITLPNGVRTYIGDKNKLVSRGAHQYQIQYTSAQQVSHSDGTDYLNWNVNGQEWTFPTDAISATVYLPQGFRPASTDAWIGSMGSQEQAYRVIQNNDGSTTFESTRRLDAYEGLTISLQLPSEEVLPLKTNIGRLIKDNIKWFSGIGLLLLLPLYYVKAWLAVGKDPQKGVVVADYHPVRGLSPAAHHFINHNKTDNKTFTVGLLNLAVKGYVHIEQTSKKTYRVNKTAHDGEATLSESEEIIYDGLFKKADHIALGDKYHANVATAKKTLARFLKKEWRDAIYQNNSHYSWFGIGIGLFALILCGLHLANAQIKVGHLLPLLIFGFIGFGSIKKNASPVMFMMAGLFVLVGLQNTAFTLFNSQIMIWLSLFAAGLFLLFHYLLKAPTPFGQKMLDEMAGFRLYLATAEQQRLNILHPPEKTPQLFEELLPYAVALGVENQWSDQFAKVFEQLESKDQQYQPRWYSGAGRFSGRNAATIGSAVATGLAGSVAAAATAPSSSSGGGFSGGAGGGGGGGGGGGW